MHSVKSVGGVCVGVVNRQFAPPPICRPFSVLHNRQFKGNGSNKGGDYDVDVGNDDDEDDVQFGIDDDVYCTIW